MASATTVSSSEITRAYRHLYRGLLQAVQYSAPARYVARDKLRNAFRTDAPKSFNAEHIENTVNFLAGAARERGIEHTILRNILHTSFWESQTVRFHGDDVSTEARRTGYVHYKMTIAMLNKDLGLCLR